MPVEQRYKPTASFDPGTMVTALEARGEIQDATLSGHFGSNVESEISTNLVHVLVQSAAEADSTTTVSAAADAIDLTAVAASTIASGWAADANATTGTLGDAGFGNWIAAAIAAGGTVTIKCQDEVIGVGAASGTAISSLTRGAEGTTPATHADATAVTLYVGTTCTTIPLDDPTVWGATGPADDYLVLICGTEQMKVDCDSIDGTNDFLVVTRGYDSTTAAAHADDAAVTQYIDETTTQFDVADGTQLTQGQSIKITATGQEILVVSSISTNRLVCTRGELGTTAAVIPTTSAVYDVQAEVELDTAIAAVGSLSEFGSQSFTVSLPSS